MPENYVKKQQFAGLSADATGQVRLTTELVDESQLVTGEPGNTGGHFNGGGEELADLKVKFSELQGELAQAKADLDAERAKNEDPRDSLTIPEIKEKLDAKEVKYSSTANKAELLELLKAQPATQE